MSFEDSSHDSYRGIFSLLRPKRRFGEFYTLNALFRKYQPYLELDDSIYKQRINDSDDYDDEHSKRFTIFSK
jgi:hypothetical protein